MSAIIKHTTISMNIVVNYYVTIQKSKGKTPINNFESIKVDLCLINY